MKDTSPPCSYCGFSIPPSVNACPHCGQPGLFPNVGAAKKPAEYEALQRRYQVALDDVVKRGAIAVLQDFETALKNSRAVICRWLPETQHMASSEFASYSTYYKLARAQVKTPTGEEWDRMRTTADAALFTNYQEELRFAALTLNDEGLFNYGRCSWVLRTEMIAHRTSVMDENSTAFYHRHKKKKQMPLGYRATWEERAKLGIAKLGAQVDTATTAAEYSALLLQQGRDSGEDQFIEAQIYGPLTIRTIAHVTLTPRATRAERVMAKDLQDKLKGFGVTYK